MNIAIWRWVRLATAVGLTAVLPVCWLMLYAFTLHLPTDFPAWTYLGTICIVAASVFLLTRKQLPSRPASVIVPAMAAVVYFGLVFLLLWRHAGSGVPFWQLVLLLCTASAWSYWCAWCWSITHVPFARVGVFIVLLGLGVGLPLLLKLNGLTGAAKVNFVWAFASNTNVGDRVPLLPLEGDDQEVTPDNPPNSAEVVASETADATGAAAANRRNQLGNRWSVSDDDFPQFLGNRQANLTPRPIRTDWKQRPPEIVWRREVGAGWSSFALIGPVAITQEQRGDEECVCCYELATGNQRWVHRCRAHFESVLGGDGPRATPTVHDRSVYAIGGTGILSCLDVVTGEEQWQVDTLADNNGEPVHHGVCGSPLIVDEMVVVTPTGRADASLVAYDCASGERRWRAGQWKASYSSPMLADIQGERQILIFTRDGLESHAPDDGTLLWSFPLTNSESTVCSQPVLIPDTDRQILLGLGYGKGSTLIEVTRSSGGAWQVDKKWSSKEMKTKFTTAVVLDGYAYGLDDGILSCIDVQTGKRRWKKGRYQHGQILLVGKWLIVQEEAGDVVLVRPQPDGLQELGHVAALSSKTWNNPALTGQYLLVRNDREAICFRIVE